MTMRETTRRGLAAIATAAALAAVAAAPARAQDYEWAAGYNAGGVMFTPLNSNSGSTADIELATGWILGLQFERWLGSGRLGLRVNGALTERELTIPGTSSPDIGVWMADADFLLRLLPATPGRTFNMYLIAGGGVVRYKLGDGDFVNYGAANASYRGNDPPRWAAVGGVGFDIITGWSWDREPIGIRIEAADHVALSSPFDPIDGGDFSPIHNVRFTIGAFTGFGLLR